MSQEISSRPSFSPARRWRIGLDVAVRTVLVVDPLLVTQPVQVYIANDVD